jgi:hypothetical protein
VASWFETHGIATLLTMRSYTFILRWQTSSPDERFALTEGAASSPRLEG